MNLRWILLILLLVGSGGAAALYGPKYLKSTDAPPTAAPPRVTVVALGRLQPHEGIVAVGGESGRRIRSLEVKEEQKVEKGAILAYLDNYPEMMASLQYTESQLEAGIKQLKAKTDVEEANIAKARSDIKDAEETRPEVLRAQEAKITKITDKIKSLQSEVDRLASWPLRGPQHASTWIANRAT